jgi:hypothetical protein
MDQLHLAFRGEPKLMVGRNVLLGLVGAFVAALTLFGLPELANAQCCAPPPPCCQAPSPPPPPCCHVPRPPPQNPVCCTPGHNVNIPGVNVFVGANVIVNAQVNAQATATSQASGQGQIIVMGGGGGGGGVIAPTGGVIQGLNVEGAMGVRRVAYEAMRLRTRRVVIQAFCFDDLNNPHPASQVTPNRDIDDLYDGELYRCIAGSHLQVTFVDWREGRIDFSGGETLSCRRGEALYHAPFRGARDGELEEGHDAPPPTVMCRPQRPARDCNERSLLRRFGAGVKVLTMVRVERYQAFREERFQQTSSSTSAFSMDGGVGGVAY